MRRPLEEWADGRPREESARQSRAPTFEQVAGRVIRLYEPIWRTGGGSTPAEVWRSSLKRYAFPRIDRALRTEAEAPAASA